MKKSTYIIWLLSLIFISCSSDEDPVNPDSERVELSFQVNSFVKPTLKSSTTESGSVEEQKIDNLYVFLFPTSDSQILKKYYIQSSTFTGGSWSSADNKISLTLTQAEAGNRDVYVVANCSDLKVKLDGITTLEGLKSVLQTNETPWSTNLKAPILMSGSKTHNFNSNYQLSGIALVRAIAKIELNVTLAEAHWASLLSDEGKPLYKYKFINFDKNTYVLKPETKPDNLTSSTDWNNWNNDGVVTSYTTNSEGNITGLHIITYLNERDNSGSAVEISLPYNGGFLPPPEFGDETYKLQLPAEIERNHWYKYDIHIGNDEKLLGYFLRREILYSQQGRSPI